MKNILLLQLILKIHIIQSFRCGYNLNQNEKIKTISIPNSKTRNLQETTHPLSIYIDYEILDNYFKSENKIIYTQIQISLYSSITLISKLITLKSIKKTYINPSVFDSKKTMNEKKIYLEEIPNIKEKTIDTDIVIIPKMVTYENIEASASILGINTNDSRPCIGAIFISNNINFIKDNSIEFFTLAFLHEITHLLVFSKTLFPYFSNIPNIKEVEINGLKRKIYSSPKVLEKAKKHFKCDSIEGIELENQGESESIGSHWESRIMLGDYMIAVDYNDVVISEITLAMFEDSGWYSVNYYTGGLFRFGKGEGCSFLYNKCIIDNKSNFGREFCVNSNENTCSSNNLSRGKCFLNQYNNIPEKYNYFNNENLGGFLYTDYCPISYYKDDTYGYFFTGCNKYGKNYNIYSNSLEEIYGENSLCILSSLIHKSYDKGLEKYNNDLRAMCYEVICDFQSKSFLINVGYNKFINCSGDYHEIENIEFYGKIICPDFIRVCTGSSFCNDIISCIEKESVYIEHNYNNINPVISVLIEENRNKFIVFSMRIIIFIIFIVF